MTDNPTKDEPTPQDAEAIDPEGQGFGVWLRCQREGREITLREISDSSKISLRYLQAFEEERFDLLPSTLFARGFLRQYARYIGLEPEEAVNYFDVARRAGDTEEETVEPRRPKRRTSVWTYMLALAAVAFLLLAVYLLSLLNDRRERTDPVPPPVALPTSPAPSAGRPAASSATEPPTAGAALGDTAAVQPAGELSSVETAEAESALQAPLRVTVDFTGQCWVEVWVDGSRALSEIRVQGESLQLDAEREVLLTFGDAEVVGVEVNGRPYTLPVSRGKVLKDLKIDLDTVAAMATAES